MHAVPAVIFLAHDPECRQVTGSRAANELLCAPREANLSMSASEADRPSHFRVLKDGVELSPEQRPLQRAARGEEVQAEEIELRFDDGSVVHLFGNALPLHDEAGKPRGALAAMLDVSQQKRLIDELKRLNQTLEHRVAEVYRQAERLRRLAGELNAAEQRERRRIAHLLHDHIQQLLVAAKMRIAGLAGIDGDSEDRTVEEVTEVLNEALHASRNLSHELYPPVLYDHGLAAALHWLSRRFEQQHTMKVEVEAETEADPVREELQAFLFQAVLELLLNAQKHGGATRAWVKTHRQRDGVLTLSIEDNGVGCDPGKLCQQHEGGAFGLFSIEERLSMLDGTTSVRSAPGEGCCIVLRLPA